MVAGDADSCGLMRIYAYADAMQKTKSVLLSSLTSVTSVKSLLTISQSISQSVSKLVSKSVTKVTFRASCDTKNKVN